MKKKLLSFFVGLLGLFMWSFTCHTDGFFPDDYDCNKFYQCSSGVATEMTCPAGLHFNAETEMCDYPANANCDSGTAAPSDCKVGNICYYNTSLGYVDACVCEGAATASPKCSLLGFTQVNTNYKRTCEKKG